MIKGNSLIKIIIKIFGMQASEPLEDKMQTLFVIKVQPCIFTNSKILEKSKHWRDIVYFCVQTMDSIG